MRPTQDDLKKLNSKHLQELGVFLHQFPDGHEEFARRHEFGGGVVGYDAFVSPYAYVGKEASVTDHACIEGCVLLQDRAYVCGNTKIIGCYYDGIKEDSLNAPPHYAIVLQKDAVVAGDASIELKKWNAIHMPKEEELHLTQEVLSKLAFGILIEGRVDGLSFVLGSELKIGRDIVFTDSRLKGHQIELAGKKKFFEKDVRDQRPSAKDYSSFNPAAQLMLEYSRLNQIKISEKLLRGEFNAKSLQMLGSRLKRWQDRKKRRFADRNQIKESLKIIRGRSKE